MTSLLLISGLFYILAAIIALMIILPDLKDSNKYEFGTWKTIIFFTIFILWWPVFLLLWHNSLNYEEDDDSEFL